MKRGIKSQCGIATVELVIVTPLLLVIFMAITEFGMALSQYHVLAGTTRDGARYAAALAANAATGNAQVDVTLAAATSNLVVFGNVNGSGSALLPGWNTTTVTVSAPDGNHVRVDAIYAYHPLFTSLPLLDGSGLSTAFQLHSSATVRAL